MTPVETSGKRRSANGPSPFASGGAALAGVRLPTLAFPADLLGLATPEHALVEVDVVVLDGDVELVRLPLRLTRRLRGKGRVELWGRDADGLLNIHLAGGGDGSWTMQASHAGSTPSGQQCLRLLDVIDSLRPPHTVGLAVRGRPVHTTSAIPAQAARQSPPKGLRVYVEAQAELEHALGLHAPVPETYTPEHGRDLLTTAALLRGETVSNTWSSLSWTVPPAQARDLLDGVLAGGGLVEVELEQTWTTRLGDRDIEVGTVLIRYRQARLAPESSSPQVRRSSAADASEDATGTDDVELRLQPGDDDTLLLRLVEAFDVGGETDPRRDAGPDQRWFWTPEWQAREREVDELVDVGAVATHDTAEDFLEHVDCLAARGQ